MGVLVVGAGVTLADLSNASSFEMPDCWACWPYLPASVSEPIAAAMIARCAIILVRFILNNDTEELDERLDWTGQTLGRCVAGLLTTEKQIEK